MGKTPHYDHLRVVGCEAYVKIPKQLRKKNDYKCRICIFHDTHTVVRSSDVIFNENKMHN